MSLTLVLSFTACEDESSSSSQLKYDFFRGYENFSNDLYRLPNHPDSPYNGITKQSYTSYYGDTKSYSYTVTFEDNRTSESTFVSYDEEGDISEESNYVYTYDGNTFTRTKNSAPYSQGEVNSNGLITKETYVDGDVDTRKYDGWDLVEQDDWKTATYSFDGDLPEQSIEDASVYDEDEGTDVDGKIKREYINEDGKITTRNDYQKSDGDSEYTLTGTYDYEYTDGKVTKRTYKGVYEGVESDNVDILVVEWEGALPKKITEYEDVAAGQEPTEEDIWFVETYTWQDKRLAKEETTYYPNSSDSQPYRYEYSYE